MLDKISGQNTVQLGAQDKKVGAKKAAKAAEKAPAKKHSHAAAKGLILGGTLALALLGANAIKGKVTAVPTEKLDEIAGVADVAKAAMTETAAKASEMEERMKNTINTILEVAKTKTSSIADEVKITENGSSKLVQELSNGEVVRQAQILNGKVVSFDEMLPGNLQNRFNDFGTDRFVQFQEGFMQLPNGKGHTVERVLIIPNTPLEEGAKPLITFKEGIQVFPSETEKVARAFTRTLDEKKNYVETFFEGMTFEKPSPKTTGKKTIENMYKQTTEGGFFFKEAYDSGEKTGTSARKLFVTDTEGNYRRHAENYWDAEETIETLIQSEAKWQAKGAMAE